MKMRKTIPAVAAILLLWSALAVSAGAEEVSDRFAESFAVSTAASESEGRVTSLSVLSYPTQTIYDAFDRFDKSGLVLRARFEGGVARELLPEEINVVYQRDTCLRVGDTHVFLSYGGVSVSVPVTVNRIEYDLSPLEISDFKVTYNGRYNSFEPSFSDVVGLDGYPLLLKVRGGGEGVGVYDISIDFESESSDYYVPDSRVVTMTVEPYRATVIWDNLSFTYDGKSKLPTAYFLDVFGNKITPVTVGSAISAGTDYKARVVFNDPNYALENTEALFEIKKANYDFSNIKWSRDSFVYDGSRKSISVSGLPSGVRVVSYVGDRAVNAGKYTVTARLSWEENNYNAPESLTHTWEISPARYDVTGFSFLPGEFVYDGKIHYPELKGKMPVGADGIPLEYSFSEGACHVSDGTVSTCIVFSSKSKNYVVPEPMYSSVTVKPQGIKVSWGACELTYSGEEQAPEATAAECVVKVRGKAINAGRYTAEAYTENTDFFIINSLVDYTVKKAENAWLSIPEGAVCYEGKIPELSAYPRFGEVQLVYYSDVEGKSVIPAPSAVGKYYAKAVVFNTENYSGIESEIFGFEIVKIVAVSFIGRLEREGLRAYETLGKGDFSCTVVNNDGSRVEVDSSLVEVKYQNGTSLRKKDEYLTLKYGSFNYKIEITVDFADYDLSGVRWCDVSQEYDGTPKTPRLTGLPEGVSVREYIGGGAIFAGSYSVSAVLDYDAENYNQPKLSCCDFTVRKKTLEIPTLTAAYNGEEHFPKSGSTLYTVDESVGFCNAGTYRVRAELLDSSNYEFEGGGAACDAYFVITPRVITVRVENVSLHLFERLYEVDYSIVSGECASGDNLTFSQYRDGARACLRSENPNYTVISLGGEITRLPYPTLGFFLCFLLVLMAVALLCLAGYFTLVKHHRIQNAVAVLKCRLKNRRMTVYPPRDVRKRTPETPKADGQSHGGDTHGDGDGSGCDLSDDAPGDEPNDGENSTSEGASEEELSGLESEALGVKAFKIDAEHADELLTDSMAKNLINRDGEIVYTEGRSKNIVNVDTLSENFSSGDRVDVNSLKDKSLVPYDTAYIKVLARGVIDKPLSVHANDFSLSAVKMIALTGGEAVKCVTVRMKKEEKTRKGTE